MNEYPTRLSTALRAASSGETQQFLTHRSALRRTMIRILADVDDSNWTLRDDELLDLAEAWLKERLLHSPGLPRVTTMANWPGEHVERASEEA
jgi:hypothetical protein